MKANQINKLKGFFELKDTQLPSVDWQIFNKKTVFDNNKLWTVRMAVHSGNDFSLPRFVGVSSKVAFREAKELAEKYGDKAIIIYYPYFIALKSGNIAINSTYNVIEAVYGDLWHLVDENKLDVNIIFNDVGIKNISNKLFFQDNEFSQLKQYISILRNKYSRIINSNQTVIVEWSFAKNSDLDKKPIGPQFLIFYELRSV